MQTLPLISLHTLRSATILQVYMNHNMQVAHNSIMMFTNSFRRYAGPAEKTVMSVVKGVGRKFREGQELLLQDSMMLLIMTRQHDSIQHPALYPK